MELKADVYNAARDGKLQRIQTSLEACPKEQVKLVVEAKTDGATPLIMACRNGHLGIVEYLVEKCHADVEQVGSVRFDGETIDGAPPLWCAAAAGHMNIVRLLVRHGAGVNKTTSTNSTPLRAACFDGHLDIVQYLVDNDADLEIANRHGHTCLMISCYKGHYAIVKYLIEKRANVNRKSIKGNTALHDCAESGSLDIMKLLLVSAAAMEKDSYGMTPLLAAAVTGHTRIVEYLIARSETTRLQRVEALELLGATYVDKKRDMLGALKFWKLAMAERYCIDKARLNKPSGASPIPAYENAVEVQTVDELNELISDPDSMRMQALLIRERILGPAHPDTSYYIRYRGAVYADMGNFERCIILWMYALDMQQKILEPLSPMTQSSFLSFAELFSFMMTDSRHWRARVVAFKDMMVVFRKSVYELGVGMTSMAKVPMTERDTTHFNRLLVIIMHLISLMCVVLPKATDDERLQFQKIAYQLVKMNPRGAKGYTPLHLACAKETSTVGRYPVCGFPSVNVAALLIKVGASVNAVDAEHNAPLHIAAFVKPCKTDLIELLLNNGAHLDACNSDHVSPMQMLVEDTTEGATDSACCCKCVAPLKYLTLQCLAARTIIKHDIKYEGCVPTKLESFVRMH